MSIFNKIVAQSNTQASEDGNKLNLQELEFLLKTLKTTQLVGEQVEMFYILVTKLQNQYMQQEAK